MKKFNIRVYALIFNEKGEILLADEEYSGEKFTKFPGGGLEWGEGLKEGLQREAREEMSQELQEIEHFYTTDFFQKSAFNPNDQLVSVYYKARLSKPEQLKLGEFPFDFSKSKPSFRWKKLEELNDSELRFPIDKLVLEKLRLEF